MVGTGRIFHSWGHPIKNDPVVSWARWLPDRLLRHAAGWAKEDTPEACEAPRGCLKRESRSAESGQVVREIIELVGQPIE